jgi:hypothetical protein
MESIYKSDVCEAFSFDGMELDQSHVAVDFSTAYARRPGPPAIEEDVLETWRKRAETNPRIFNGSKFRLHSLSFAKTPPQLHLCVALTDYRTFLGTHYSPSASDLKKLGQEMFSDPMACLSNKIGVGALVTLCDGRLVLMQRSNTVAECQGLVDVPGGHPEPKEVGLGHETRDDSSGSDQLSESIEFYKPSRGGFTVSTQAREQNRNKNRVVRNLLEALRQKQAENMRLRAQLLPYHIKRELFDSVMEEVRAEINIPLARMSPPKLLGVVNQLNSQGTPSFIFTTNCDLNSEQVQKLWEQGAEEKDESVALLLLEEKEIVARRAAGKIHLTPATTGAIELWCKHLHDGARA